MAVDNRMLRREPNEIFVFEDFITAVPSGASSTGDLKLPEGTYIIQFYGTQVAATTPPTLQLDSYLSADKVFVVPLFGFLNDDTAGLAAIPLDVAKTVVMGQWLAASGQSLGFQVGMVYIGPGGARWTYTKNGGTAIRLSLVAKRI